jgi:hypothetical protein
VGPGRDGRAARTADLTAASVSWSSRTNKVLHLSSRPVELGQIASPVHDKVLDDADRVIAALRVEPAHVVHVDPVLVRSAWRTSSQSRAGHRIIDCTFARASSC